MGFLSDLKTQMKLKNKYSEDDLKKLERLIQDYPPSAK